MKDTTKNSLSELLLALRRKINESVKEKGLKDELTVSQFEVLWFIGPAGRKSMESIATYLNIKPPSVTVLIDKLEKAGLVTREKDGEDRRIIHIVLTEKTKQQLVAFKEKKEAVFNELLSRLSSKDAQELERILLLLIAP
ncbi:MAG: MarR family transcriptional regulator [Patescibacteria group bacterium]